MQVGRPLLDLSPSLIKTVGERNEEKHKKSVKIEIYEIKGIIIKVPGKGIHEQLLHGPAQYGLKNSEPT